MRWTRGFAWDECSVGGALVRAQSHCARRELLSVRATRKPASISTRLKRRIKQIEAMPAKPKQQLLGIIDTFIVAHQ